MRALGLGLLFVSMTLIGCGPDLRAECEAEVKCKGGNDADIDACVAVGEVFVDYLADIGCDDEFDAQFECTSPLKSCQSSPTGDPCMTGADCRSDEVCSNNECVEKSYTIDAADRDKCEAEAAAYSRCSNLN